MPSIESTEACASVAARAPPLLPMMRMMCLCVWCDAAPFGVAGAALSPSHTHIRARVEFRKREVAACSCARGPSPLSPHLPTTCRVPTEVVWSACAVWQSFGSDTGPPCAWLDARQRHAQALPPAPQAAQPPADPPLRSIRANGRRRRRRGVTTQESGLHARRGAFSLIGSGSQRHVG